MEFDNNKVLFSFIDEDIWNIQGSENIISINSNSSILKNNLNDICRSVIIQEKKAIIIQKNWKKFLCREKYLKLIKAINILKTIFMNRKIKKLKEEEQKMNKNYELSGISEISTENTLSVEKLTSKTNETNKERVDVDACKYQPSISKLSKDLAEKHFLKKGYIGMKIEDRLLSSLNENKFQKNLEHKQEDIEKCYNFPILKTVHCRSFSQKFLKRQIAYEKKKQNGIEKNKKLKDENEVK